jgi:hypothetical protein
MKKERNEQKKHLIWQHIQEEAAQKEFNEILNDMHRLLQNPEALQRIREYFGYIRNQNYTKRRKYVPEKLSVGIRKSIDTRDLELLN